MSKEIMKSEILSIFVKIQLAGDRFSTLMNQEDYDEAETVSRIITNLSAAVYNLGGSLPEKDKWESD